MTLPALAVETPDGPLAAINDVAIHRRHGSRVAQLSYAVHGEEVGSVRCDGLVLATPAGSTGYNLANGGPVMAWGVEGFVVSFIAPHSLTARSLVVSPDDLLTSNARANDPVDISMDGQPGVDRSRARTMHGQFPRASRGAGAGARRRSTAACEVRAAGQYSDAIGGPGRSRCVWRALRGSGCAQWTTPPWRRGRRAGGDRPQRATRLPARFRPPAPASGLRATSTRR